mmetsp:Transcript_36624/g.92100  ORF Transcript_36624/g.92100 Transcript_36624/m.92100 type:complete len:152 (-) Transcript_36624:203-658(-)
MSCPRRSVCIVEFEECSIPLPGTQSAQKHDCHPAPCPLLLSLRSVNTWICHLQSQGKLGAEGLTEDACLFLACHDMTVCWPDDCGICWDKMKQDDPKRCSEVEAERELLDSSVKGVSTPVKRDESKAAGSSPDSTASAASQGSTSKASHMA